MGYRALHDKQGVAQKMEGEDGAVQGRAQPGAPSEGASTHPDTTAAAKCRATVQLQVWVPVDPFQFHHSSGAAGSLPNPSELVPVENHHSLAAYRENQVFFKDSQHRIPILLHLGLQEHFNLLFISSPFIHSFNLEFSWAKFPFWRHFGDTEVQETFPSRFAATYIYI